MGKRGKKICPNCNEEKAARLQKCGCGFDFLAARNKKRAEEDLIRQEKDRKREEKRAAKEKILQDKRDEKKSKRDVKDERTLSPEMLEMLAVPLPGPQKKITPKAHAKRILSYGKDRAI